MESQHSWKEIQSRLKELVPSHLFHSVIDRARISECTSEKLSLLFEDHFSKEHFEQRCLNTLKELLTTSDASAPPQIMLSVSPSEDSNATQPVYGTTQNIFDSKYRFGTFVIGASNQFAHAACQAVSNQPGQCYNPLFIFGDAGLGKTHLLRAIGHALQNSQPNLRILLLTSEAFTNEMIQAIRVDQMKEFRDKYRFGCDVLLLDDVHFFAGKERTQEEFFYTFNYLHESRRQIVVTSDRYPKEIEGLESRLQTRFEWGLVADVQPPDIETRIAILKNKAEGSQILLPDEVAEFIAAHVTTNIRELEGSLHRLQAYAALTSSTISLELAREIMRDISPKARHELTPEAILKLVALQFNVRAVELRSEKRVRRLAVPRQVCMYLLRKFHVMSYPEIGKFLGGRDHSTIMHGVDKIGRLVEKGDPEILQHVNTIESLVK